MSDQAVKYEIWASGQDQVPEAGDSMSWVDLYTTREGALAKARVLLKQGRSVEIIPVPDNAPPSEARELTELGLT